MKQSAFVKALGKKYGELYLPPKNWKKSTSKKGTKKQKSVDKLAR